MMQRQSLTTYQQQSDDQPVFEQQLLWNSLKHNQLVKYFYANEKECKWEGIMHSSMAIQSITTTTMVTMLQQLINPQYYW